MSKNYLKVDVVSPSGSVFTGEADMVVLRGSAGEMGVTYGHTELLSTVPPGLVSVKKDGNIEASLYVAGGIVEVTPSRVIIMVDEMERAENINQAEAKKAKAGAEKVLKNLDASKLDVETAHIKLKEADARLKAINFSKGLYYSSD